jgi:iron complex outermembrane receptor protein/hemoglobin/transferrin/lactoferrin receptor protein
MKINAFLILWTAFLFSITDLSACSIQKDSIPQDSTVILIKEVSITAKRQKSTIFDGTSAVSILKEQDLMLHAPMSMPDALTSTPGVWMQKTNHGGGSPFVRGLTGYQNLLLIDGIRFNNSTFRSGPNQYLNTIDPLMIERIEVVRGQGSVQYGSDAIGGVIQMISYNPQFSTEGKHWSGLVYGKYLSDDMEQTGRLRLDLSMENTAISIGTTAKNLGDIIAGGDLGKLDPTGYKDRSMDFKLLHKNRKNHLFTVAYQHHIQKDVPLFHKIISDDYQLYLFDPQQRDLAYMKWEIPVQNKWIEKIRIVPSYHRSLEGRIKQKSNRAIIKSEKDKVQTLGTIIEFISKPTQTWHISSGIEYYHDKIKSLASEKSENSTTAVPQRGLYPNNASSGNFAIFSLHTIENKNFNYTFGMRYNAIKLKVKEEDFGQTTLRPNAFVANAGITYKVDNNFRIFASVDSGFRAPNINDVSSLGIADFRYEIPNFNLKPERSVNFEVGFRSKFNRFSTNTYFYQTNLTDLITNVRSTFNGQSTIDGTQVYQRINIEEAKLRGFESDIEYLVTSTLLAKANITYTYGENTSNSEPMRRIPPLFGSLNLLWNLNSKFKLNGTIYYAGKQDRLSPGDIDDDRIAANGTPAWKSTDLSLHYIGEKIRIQSGLKNLFNEAYRTHGSGVDGIGRNLWVSVNFSI